MFKVNTAGIFWKCLASNSRSIVGGNGSYIAPTSWSMALSRDFMTSETSVYSSTTSVKSSLPVPPKRSPNVFALFVKNSFKDMPADLPVKQKFIRAAEEWRELSENQKEEYKKQMTEGLVQYKKQMADYLDSLSPQELDDFKKQRKVSIPN